MATPTRPLTRTLPYPLRFIHNHWRLATSATLGILVWALSPVPAASTRGLIGWDVGVICYLILAFRLIVTARTDHIQAHAARDDEGRLAILILTVGGALASLAAILIELRTVPGVARTPVQLMLTAATIVLSWAFTHTIFALNYAHEYYGEHGGKRSGLDFPGVDDPDYWDFVYLSFGIGTTCQVSDVAVTSRLVRRTVTAHAVVSFFFNTALLALTVNIAASAI